MVRQTGALDKRGAPNHTQPTMLVRFDKYSIREQTLGL